MVYAADVFATTLANLIKNGYIQISKGETKTLKLLGILISTEMNYLVQLTNKPLRGLVIGWLEEKIFDQLRYHQINLETVLFEILSEVFDNNHKLTNPGKFLILAIIQNQKIGIYNYKHSENWMSNRVTLQYNRNFDNQKTPGIYKLEDFTLPEVEVSDLRRKVSSNLKRFQKLD